MARFISPLGQTPDTKDISSSGNFTIDAIADIVLDADGDEIIFKDGITNVGHISMDSDNLTIKSLVSDKDIIVQGNDGGSGITAITLDMSAAGKATFNNEIVSGAVITSGAGLVIADDGTIGSASDADAITIAANGNTTFSQDVTVSGNLTVSGTTTQINTVTMNAENAVVFEGATADAHETTLTIIDPTADRTQRLLNQSGFIPLLAAVTTTAITSTPEELNILDGATVVVGEINALDLGSTAVGTAIASKAVILDSNKDYTGIRNFTIDGDLDVGDDLFLTSDSAKITFGANSEITATHVHNVGLTLTHTATGDNTPMVLQLKSEEDAIIANEVIGSLEFAAGDSGGTDGATVAAGIHAIAEGTFSASANATKLVFTTGVSETAASSATAKMTLSSAGLLTIADDFVIKDGGTIGVASDADAITIASNGQVTLTQTLIGTALDISGDVDIDGTLEADAITVNGTTLAETISDTVGAMVGSNTETGIAVTYQDDNNTIDFALDAAQTTITSLLATDIKIGEDDQTKIDFETADEIHFYAANAHQIKLVDGALVPVTDNDIDLGTSSLEFKDAFFDGTVTSDAFAGPLTGNVTGNVSGTAATVTGAAQTNITSLGTLTALTVDDINLNGKVLTITGSTDDTFTITSGANGATTLATTDAASAAAGNITLNADGYIELDSSSNAAGAIYLDSSGTNYGIFFKSNNDFTIRSQISDGDMIFQGNDGGSIINALTLDMSAAGKATFNNEIVSGAVITSGAGLVIADAGTIGSASDTDAIAIASDGVVTFSQAPVFPDGSIAVADLDIDGATDVGAALVDADLFIVDDGAGGTNRKSTLARLKTYMSAGSTTAADDIDAGDAAVTITTSSGNITIDAAANDSDIILKGTDGGADTDFLTIDGSAAGKATFNNEIVSGAVITSGAGLVIADAGNIGSASDTDAIAIASDGVVTMNQIPVFSAGINVSGGTIAGTLATAAQTNITSLGTLTTLTVDNVVINGATIGHGDDTDLMTVADGILTVAGEVSMTTLDIGGTNVTSTAAELNILDGVTSTAAELNVLDGITAVVGELNALDLGSTAVGNAIASKAVILDSNKDYTGVRNLTISGELDAGSLDISGDVDVDGTLEADAITVNGATLTEHITDLVGGMVGGNTETGITVTFQDDDNTLDFALGAAQTTITSLLATDIKIGEDDQTKIDFETADEIHFYAANAHQIKLVDGALVPATDNDVDLGTSSAEFKDAYFDGTVTADAFAGPITGNLTGTLQTAAQGNVTSLGTLTTLTVDNVVINGATIGHGDDTDLMTVADGILTVAGEVSVTTLDIGGTNVTSTAAELNILDGVTSTAAELNILDGVTSTAAELNILDGVTSTAAELNVLDGITAVVGELNALDLGSTAVGTAIASKAVILDSNKDYTGMRNLTISGEIDAATGDFSGDVDVAGTTTVVALTASGRVLVDDTTDATSTTDGSLQTDGGLSVAKDAVFGDDVKLLSDGSRLFFGAGNDIIVTHLHNSGLRLAHGGSGDNAPVVFQLKSEEDAIETNEVIGSLEFAAGDSDGTDGATVAAGIHAIAEADFSASVNKTKLVFTTGFSETAASSATAKMTLSSAGLLTIADDFVIKDGGTIGSASDTDAIAIASDGVVTMNQIPVFSAGINVSGGTIAGTLATAAQGNITSLGTLTTLTVDNVVINGATIGHGDDTDLMTVADGILTVAGEVSMTTLDIGGTNVTSTAAELNILDGVTSTAAELNILDGVTSTAAELNILDGVTSTAAELNILDGVTSTAAELNALDGITAVVGELNALDLGSTAVGTAIASKAVILDSNKDYTGIRNLTISGELDAGSLDISGDVDVDGTLEADAITVNGKTLTEFVTDTAGAMVSSNTETGITVTFQDDDNTIDFALAAAQTTITSLLATDIKIGEDDQTKIDFETADEIHFYAANAHQIKLVDGALVPVTDNDVDLGTSSLEFKDAFFDGTVTSDAFAGPLTGDVTGTSSKVTVTNSTANTNFPVVFNDESDSLLDDTGALRYNPSSGTLLVPNLVVAGTTTQVDTVTMNAANAVVFEGATADDHETTLTIIDPTGDRTINLPNVSGTIPVLAAASTTQITSTPAELNILDGATVVVGEINALDLGSTAVGTAIASKAVILDSNKDYTGMRNLTISGELDAGSLDISGNVDVDGTLETDAFSIGGTTVTSTAAELNILDGVTSTAAELNILDGVTSTAAELNILDGVTSTAAELNALDGITAVVGELNALDIGSTAVGTAVASKAVILDSNKDYTGIRNLTISGELDAGSLDVSGDIDVDGTTNLDVVDIDGAVDMASTLGVAGVVTANAGVVVDNITIDGTEIDLSSGDLTLDVAGDIILNADGADIKLADASVTFGHLSNSSSDFVIESKVQDKDIIFKGDDGGSGITALTLDMSNAGSATFNDDVKLGSDSSRITFGTHGEILLKHVHNVGLTVTNTVNGSDDTPVVLQLKSEEDAIIADDVIASIEMAAGDSDGTDGATVAAGIHAIAEDTFSASANKTKLVFTTGVSETAASSATAKATLSSIGDFTVAGDLIIKDGGTIGSASDLDAIAIASDGVVTMNQIPVFSAGINVSGGSIAGTLSTAAQGNITSLGTLTTLTVDNVVINGATIGHGDDTDLMTVADGILTVAGEVSMTTLDIGGTNVTSTAAELNILDGVTSTAAELNALDGITAVVGELNALDIGSTAVGTAVASKAVILDSNKDYTGIRNLTLTGKLDAPIIEGKGGVTYDPPGSTGSDTASDVAIAVHSGDRIVLGDQGYIRTLIDAAWGSALLIGQSGTAAFAGTEIYGGHSGVTLKHSTSTILATTANGITVSGGIIIADAGTIGSASDTNAIAIGSDGDVTLTQDLELQHDGATISFGANDDVVLTHVADSGLTLSVPATADNSFPTLTLAAGDNDIAANDVLGALDFVAPAEGAGTDAIAVAGSVRVISEGNFAADNNASKMSFMLGSSEAATEKMSLSSAGVLATASLDISGDVDIDGTLEADAITVNGATLTEFITDLVGGMVGSNTETGITVTFQDGDNTLDFALGAAQTTITSLLATDIKIGEDDQTKIDFETADEIHFYAANAHQIKLVDGALVPVTDNDIDLGTSSLEFKNAFFDGTVTADAFAGPINGDLTGTLQTAAQANVTSLGTLTALTVDDVVINGKVITITGDTDDTFTITSGTHGATTLATTDAAGTNGNIILDADGNVVLDGGASGGPTQFNNSGTRYATVVNSGNNLHIRSDISDGDLLLRGNDGGSFITALTLDMSDAGAATFNDKVTIGDGKLVLNSTAVTSTAAELNILDGVTSTAAELNILDGVTSTAAELNILDGVTSTAAELNVLDGITAVVGELNALDIGSTAVGTAVASKAVILDSNKDYSGIRNLTLGGNIVLPDNGDIGSATTNTALRVGGNGNISIFQDLFVGDDANLASDAARLSFGANYEIRITHVHDVGLTLTNTIADTDNTPIVFQLKSEEDAIVADDVIASLEFAAGDSDGTDGATVAAGIHAIAEGTFSASANATKLVFTTGVSETAASSATAKMTLSSAGLLTIADDFVIKDGGTIGSASDTDAIAIGSDGDVTLTQDLELQHDGAILSFGANDEVTLTHVHNDGLLLNADMQLQFRDSAINIRSDADGDLDINADDEIELNSTLIDINGNVEMSGTVGIGGAVTIDGGTSSSLDLVCDDDGNSIIRARGTGQGSGVVEVAQSTHYGGGMSYNGDANPAIVSGETADHVTFYRLNNGTRSEVFHYPYNSDTVSFNGEVSVVTLDIGGTNVTSTAAELNILDGVTSTAAELNILDGVTSTTAELNILDGVTSTAAELNVLDGITAVVGELNALDIGSTAVGTAVASKAVILDSNKDYTGIRNLTISGELDAGSLDVSGDIDVDGTTNLDVVDIDGAVDMASTLGVSGVVTANAGVVVDNITIDGTEIDLSSGDLTVDVAGDIILNADGGDVKLADASVTFGHLSNSSSDFVIESKVQDKDIIFKGDDGGSGITALTLDMSDAGNATFNNDVTIGQNIKGSGYLWLLTDGQKQYFGANAEISVAHVHDVGLTLANSNTGDNKPFVLQLKSEEDAIIANEVIGSLEFAAGDSDGTDGATVAAGIHAIAEGTFSASANATKLVFTTGVSETAASSATAKMTLSSAGLLTIADDFVIKDGGTIGSASDTDAIAIASNGVVTFSQIPVLPDNTVSTGDLQADAVTGAKIADDAINSEHYTDGSIDTAHIADDQITQAKMANDSVGSAEMKTLSTLLIKNSSGSTLKTLHGAGA